MTKVPSSSMSGRAMIIVAGGASSRFGGDKLMTPIAGRPLVLHTVAAVAGMVDICVLVCRDDQADALRGIANGVTVVSGGATRTQSELAGLDALSDEIDLIGIHDGARPLISPGLIDLLFGTAAKVGGAVPVLPPSRPLVRRSDLGPVPEAAIAQTPQVFRGPALQMAYRAAAASGFEGHDSADVVREFSDLTIAAVEGDPDNIKVTYQSDLDTVRAALDPSHNEPR
ncbi:MAG: 2-C-methyl-D-erythritol 4-phosphate cytidylyltransferase [Acidimicrobiia bacterium]